MADEVWEELLAGMIQGMDFLELYMTKAKLKINLPYNTYSLKVGLAIYYPAHMCTLSSQKSPDLEF